MAEGTNSNAGTWYRTSGSCIDVAEREHKFLNSEMKNMSTTCWKEEILKTYFCMLPLNISLCRTM